MSFDLALLAGFDHTNVEMPSGDSSNDVSTLERALESHARAGVQSMVNTIFSLPFRKHGKSAEEAAIVELPRYIETDLPREKPVPVPKPLTKWERYAKAKGIPAKKGKMERSRMAWDAKREEFVPRWGYQGKSDQVDPNWLKEVPQNVDPFEDQFEKEKEEKRSRVSKDAKNHLKNLDHAAKLTGKKSTRQIAQQSGPAEIAQRKPLERTPREIKEARKEQVQRELASSRTATASLGRFDKKLEGEPRIRGLKRKFDPDTIPSTAEKEKGMSILKTLEKGPTMPTEGELNVRKAIKYHSKGQGSAALAAASTAELAGPGKRAGKSMKKKSRPHK